jgi:hypothetical protein
MEGNPVEDSEKEMINLFSVLISSYFRFQMNKLSNLFLSFLDALVLTLYFIPN